MYIINSLFEIEIIFLTRRLFKAIPYISIGLVHYVYTYYNEVLLNFQVEQKRNSFPSFALNYPFKLFSLGILAADPSVIRYLANRVL